MQKYWLGSVCALGGLLALGGCGDEKKKPADDAGMLSDAPVEDAPVADSPVEDPVNITAFVRNAAATKIEGVVVHSYNAAGTELGSDTTDADGEFTVPAEAGEVNFIRVEPTDDEVGIVIAFEVGSDVPNIVIDGGITIEDRSDYDGNVDSLVGDTATDVAKGHVVLGFTFGGADMQAKEDLSEAAAGLGAVIDVDGEDTWKNFILDAAGIANVLSLNGGTLPELCSNLPGTICRDTADVDEPMFFVNVDPGSAEINLVLPGTASCEYRSGHTGNWPVFADTRTLVVVDCVAVD